MCLCFDEIIMKKKNYSFAVISLFIFLCFFDSVVVIFFICGLFLYLLLLLRSCRMVCYLFTVLHLYLFSFVLLTYCVNPDLKQKDRQSKKRMDNKRKSFFFINKIISHKLINLSLFQLNCSLCFTYYISMSEWNCLNKLYKLTVINAKPLKKLDNQQSNLRNRIICGLPFLFTCFFFLQYVLPLLT